jgi:uncharacterized Zn finger protein (UPF0148 family)
MPTCEFILDPKKPRTRCKNIINTDKYDYKKLSKKNGGEVFCSKHIVESIRKELQEAYRKVARERRARRNQIARDKKLAAQKKADEEFIEIRLSLIKSHQARWYKQASDVFEQVMNARQMAPDVKTRRSTNEMTESGEYLTSRINAGRTVFYGPDMVRRGGVKKYVFEFKGGTSNPIYLSMDIDCVRYEVTRNDITNGMRSWGKDGLFDDSESAKNKFRFYQNHKEGDILVHVDFS